MKPDFFNHKFFRLLITVVLLPGILLICSDMPSAVRAQGTIAVTQEMENQAEADLDALVQGNEGVVNGLVDMATHFIGTWIDVPRIKLSAALMKIFIPRFRETVPTPDNGQIYSWIEGLCQWENRRPGSPGGHAAEQWIADKFTEFGLENVSMQSIDIDAWKPSSWSLTVDGDDIPCFFYLNTGFTDTAGVTAPLAYVGLGLPGDFDRVDVNGKIAVVEVLLPYLPSGALLSIPNSNFFISDPGNTINFFTGQFLTFIYTNLWAEEPGWAPAGSEIPIKSLWSVYDSAVEHGAKGVVLLLANKPSKYNSQYAGYDDTMKPLPAVWVGKYDAIKMRRLAMQKKTARLVLTGTIDPGYMRNVWGVLPGQSDDTIIICSHQDSAFRGATEDATGITQVFSQAWAWAQVPQYKRPKTLVFVAAAGHLYSGWGGYSFAYDHPEIMKNTWVVMNLEHMAAKEVVEDRGEYKETGLVAPSIIWTEENPRVVAALSKAMDRKPAKRAVSLPAYYWIPFSDVGGYVAGAEAVGLPRIPVISWISNPYYLLDEQDTLDKVKKDELGPLAQTMTEIVKNFMAMRSRP